MNIKERQLSFIGIGAEKSATTWCWACLNEHPDICMSYPKELNYFNDNYGRGREWYLSHFAHPERKIIGEISPLYMDDPEVCRRIYSDFPEVTILVILRNPYERALSHLLMDAQTLRGGVSDIGLPALSLMAKSDDKYIRRSLYFQALSRFVEQFGREHIKVLFYEAISADNLLFVKKLYEAVGADPSFVPSVATKTINKTQDYRFPKAFRLLRILSRSAKANPITNTILEWIHRRTRLREWTLDRIQIDRGRPEFRADEVFSLEAMAMLADDIKRLTNEMDIAVPENWYEQKICNK